MDDSNRTGLILGASQTDKEVGGWNKKTPKRISRCFRNGALMVLVVIGWILTNGCFSTQVPLPPVELEDFHFKPRISRNNQTVDLHPGRTFWLRQGDELEVRYKTFETHWQRREAPCPFDDNTSTDECTICDYCSTYTQGFCSTGAVVIPPYDALLSYKGFIVGEGAEITVLDTLENNGYTKGCPNSSDPKTVTPLINTTLRFISPTVKNEPIGEGKVHVLNLGEKQTVAYQLSAPATIGQIDSKDYWTWNVRSDRLRPISTTPPIPPMPGDELWSENFSPNLRITNVRILKGVCYPDPLSGNCIAPIAGPINESAVMPSKILFLPDFVDTVANHPVESSHLCYPDATATDLGSFINLDLCRTRNDSTPPIAKLATPTYDLFEQLYLARMTWAVAFDNVSDQSDADLRTPCDRTTRVGCDLMPPDQNLIIEFTLQAAL